MLSKLFSATVQRRAHHLQSSALFILTTLNWPRMCDTVYSCQGSESIVAHLHFHV